MNKSDCLFRAFRFRLEPIPEQAQRFAEIASTVRFVYNLALEQRRDFWRQAKATGSPIGLASQSRELTALRAEADWLAAVPRVYQDQALRDLAGAYQHFFRGEGYPSFRSKGRSNSFRCKGRDTRTVRLNAKWSAVFIPGVGEVKYRDTRALAGTIKTLTIKRSGNHWFAHFAVETECDIQPSTLPAVGVDRGIANTVSLSTGEHLSLPASLGTVDRKLRRAQRVVSRRRKGSNRRAVAKARVARLAAQRARIRSDWHHRTSRYLADNFGTVVFEDLKIRNMMAKGRGKHGLNRSIANQGWHQLETLTAYKLAERGGRLLKVPPHYSSQTCAECGAVDARNRKSQSAFVCIGCGHADHADTNAARIILRRSSASMDVEGSRWAPVEASTINRSAAA